MTFNQFRSMFHDILLESPLPNGDVWDFQHLGNKCLVNKTGWMEVLHRTRARYECNHRHEWKSAWTMILFRFRLNRSTHYGTVRMRRFGQRCRECPEDLTYNVGFCPLDEAWRMTQYVLLNIMQRCYEGRRESDVEDTYYIIPVDHVGGGGRGGSPHSRFSCEACAHNQCQDRFRELTKKT